MNLQIPQMNLRKVDLSFCLYMSNWIQAKINLPGLSKKLPESVQTMIATVEDDPHISLLYGSILNKEYIYEVVQKHMP